MLSKPGMRTWSVNCGSERLVFRVLTCGVWRAQSGTVGDKSLHTLLSNSMNQVVNSCIAVPYFA